MYWKSRLGDAPAGATGILYINRAHNQGDMYRPKPISTIEASEIWNEGTPYVPNPSTAIAIWNNFVGIGKTIPTHHLDVIGNINFTGDLYKNNVLFSGGSDWIKTGNNITYNSGNVGIGNTNPLYQLSLGTHLINGGDGKLYIGKNTGNGSARFFTVKYNSSYDMCFSDSDNKDVLRDSHSAPANSLYINGSGNVGIGTGNAPCRLTIRTNYNDENSGLFLDANDGAPYNIKFFSYVIGSGQVGHRFKLQNLGSVHDNMLCFASNGNVGIGNNNPPHKLTVTAGLGCDSLYVSNFTSVGGNQWHNGGGRPVWYFGGDGRNYYRASGYDGHNWRNAQDITRMFLNNDGDLYCGRFINWSDERIKKDIVDISDTEALDKILLIEPKKYKYIEETKPREVIGFIAQQIKEVIPHAVSIGEGTLPNGDIIEDFHYLDKMAIYTLNVCATQELHRIITRQQTVIDNLIARLEALEAV